MALNRSLNWDITAKDKTGGAIKSVKSGFASIAKSLGSIKTAIGGAFAVGAVVAFTKSSLNAADAIAKTADRIGIGTSALQEYQVAADLAGVSGEQLTGGLQSFTKRMGELRAGTGTLTEFLKKYDEQLLETITATSSTDEALEVLFKALGDTEDAAAKAALGAAAFGRSAGIEMTTLVKDGAAGLEDMRQKARDLGLVLDEDLLRNSEEANDALSLLGKVVLVNLQKIILELAPHIANLAAWLGENVPHAIKVLEQGFAESEAQIKAVVKVFDDVVTAGREMVGAVEDFFERMSQAATAALGEVRDTIMAVEDFFGGMADSVTSSAEAAKDGVVGFFKEMADVLVGNSIVPETVDEIESQFNRLLGAAQVVPTEKAVEEVLRQMQRLPGEAVPAAEVATDEIALSFESMTDRILSSLVDFAERGSFGWRDFVAGAVDIFRTVWEPGVKEAFIEGVGGMGDTAEAVFTTALDGILAFVEGGEFSLRGFLNVALSIFKKLMDGAGGLSGVLGAIFGGSGGASGGGGGFLSSVFGAGSAAFGGPGHGGTGGFSLPASFARGGGMRIGGNGGTDTIPVSFMASPREEVSVLTPEQQMKKETQGVTIVQNYDFSGASSATAFELRKESERIKRETLAAVEPLLATIARSGNRTSQLLRGRS